MTITEGSGFGIWGLGLRIVENQLRIRMEAGVLFGLIPGPQKYVK